MKFILPRASVALLSLLAFPFAAQAEAPATSGMMSREAAQRNDGNANTPALQFNAAEEEAAAKAAAEAFLAGYIKADADNVAWVAKSKLVTPEFKAAFKKAMAAEVVDADPVLFAQDVPSTPFKAAAASVKDGKATIQVVAKFSDEPYKLTVTLVSKGGQWLVSKTAAAQ